MPALRSPVTTAQLALATVTVALAWSSGHASAITRNPPVMEGWLGVTYTCGNRERGGCRTAWDLETPAGKRIPLEWLPDVSREATVQRAGSWVRLRGHGGVGGRTFTAAAFEAETSPPPGTSSPKGSAPVRTMGRKPYVTLLLRFADSPQVEPQPASYFERLQGNDFPEVGHYFREASSGLVDLSGFRVLGWRTLPGTRAAYQRPEGGFDLLRALRDATTLANPEVRFPDYSGIHLVFNEAPFPHSGYAALKRLHLDGQAKVYGVTWQAPFFGNYSQATWIHETGHTFGFAHSSGPYSATYDSRWDVMSDSFSFFHPAYQWIAEGTIGYHQQLAGWISPQQRISVGRGETRTLTLQPLSEPDPPISALPTPSAQAHLAHPDPDLHPHRPPTPSTFHPAQPLHPRLVRLPLDRVGRRFYTLEARTRSGYDAALPGSGVLIHAVDTARADRLAQVVDPDGNGDPNDDGALWTPGETFTDPNHGIAVEIVDAGGGGWSVTVRRGGGRLVVPAGLRFRRTAVGARRTRTLILRNASPTESLTVGLGKLHAPFTLAISDGPHVLPPRGRLTVPVTFTPLQPGPAVATLSLTTSDPRRKAATVRLRGTSR